MWCVGNLQTYGRPIPVSDSRLSESESVDAIFQPDLLFQITVESNVNTPGNSASNQPEVNLAGINTAIGYMQHATQQRFFVAVPETRFNAFDQVSLMPAGSTWPASIGNRLFKLCIPLHTHDRTRQEWMMAAELKLQNQHVDSIVCHVAIAYAARTLPVDTSDMAELVSHGMTQVHKKPLFGTTLLKQVVGDTDSDPDRPSCTIKIYRKFTGRLAYKIQ